MIEIDRTDDHTYMVKKSSYKRDGLVIHGYGGNKEEMLGLAVNLAEKSDLRLAVFDLPGHGNFENKEFTLDNSIEAIRSAMEKLDDPKFFIGHSVGARLGLLIGLPIAALISPPGEIIFEGGRGELLRVLRARRVNETTAYAGLEQVLATDVTPAPRTLLLRASQELKSVTSLVKSWRASGIDDHRIDKTDHLDIISSPKTHEIIGDWLNE
jgi:hypothetical protein